MEKDTLKTDEDETFQIALDETWDALDDFSYRFFNLGEIDDEDILGFLEDLAFELKFVPGFAEYRDEILEELEGEELFSDLIKLSSQDTPREKALKDMRFWFDYINGTTRD